MNSVKLQDTKSTHKNELCLYTNNEQSAKEIKKSIMFTVVPKTIKYLGVNLTKEMKEFYTENYKMLWEEIKHK